MGATFGRKGIADAEPVRRRAEFFVPPASADEAPEDEMASRRAAFLASERARAEHAAPAESHVAAPAASPAPQVRIVGGKSLGVAYVLWLFLAGISAHRFYLLQPLTGVLQTALWYVSLMMFMAGHEEAIYPMVAGSLWILVDLILMPGLHRAANEKIAARLAPNG